MKKQSKEPSSIKLTIDNCYVMQKGTKYRIAIKTDRLGNYIHSRDFVILDTCLAYRDALLGSCIDSVKVKSEGTYFRLLVSVNNGDIYEDFHSRKMNLIDLQYERNNLLGLHIPIDGIGF